MAATSATSPAQKSIKKNQAANSICLLPDFVSRMRVELTRANAHYPLKVARLPFRHLDILGAKNGTRTRDLNLGKVALYQLSYFRNYLLQWLSLFPHCECKVSRII